MLALISLFLTTQAAAPAPGPAPVPAPPTTLAQDRLTVCLDQARNDPATAIVTADSWLEETSGAQSGMAQQCLGTAYVSLLRWGAAEAAFVAGRDAQPPGEVLERAKLGAMAGNAALGGQRAEAALPLLDQAQDDARAAAQTELAGTIAADRARALVALGRQDEAATALADARRDAPQHPDIWLLSATLARRMGALDEAQGYIETAAALEPREPSIALEAGLIAAMAGQNETARANWRSVIRMVPGSSVATTAADYLAQLDGAPPTR